VALARTTGDRQHEANLLWHLAIQKAELGKMEQAVQEGTAAISLFRNMANPQADIFEIHLKQYLHTNVDREGPAVGNLPVDLVFGGSVSTLGMSTVPQFQTGSSEFGAGSGDSRLGTASSRMSKEAGLLRMAFSAVRSMSKFAGSGFKRATPDTYQARVQVCASCKHHTGLRCKICGCFTNVKARLLHEACPIGKWPR
jgi:hypothetical protein